MSVVIRNGRVWTGSGALARADVLMEGERIAAVGDVGGGADREIDAAGRVVMPAFVDCHTHACWAGDRLEEWEMRRRGATYLEILRSGGGIMSTVRAVREASEESLAAGLRERLWWMLGEGTATVEVKSGYGLETGAELKMLRAIRRAAEGWPGTVVATACIGHALDPAVERGPFVERTIEETLPAVHAEFPGVAVDAYCEEGAWGVEECVALFERARSLGHPCRVHADQFTSLGMVREAVRLGLVSVDHLEATGRGDLEALGRSGTAAVVLPCTGLHVDGRYADARAVLDAGGRVAVGTNWNPGSSPCGSMPMAMALAVRCCGLSVGEALAGGTWRGAEVLGFADRGRVEVGARADVIVLSHRDERMLVYAFGGRAVDVVVCGGQVVWEVSGGNGASRRGGGAARC